MVISDDHNGCEIIVYRSAESSADEPGMATELINE